MKFIGKSGKTIVEHLQEMLNEPALFAEMTGYQTDAVREAIKTLAEDNNAPVKQPDPITGLVPCGCGGKAIIEKGINYHSGYYVICEKCECNIGLDRDDFLRPFGAYPTAEQAVSDWNRAMGYKGGAE